MSKRISQCERANTWRSVWSGAVIVSLCLIGNRKIDLILEQTVTSKLAPAQGLHVSLMPRGISKAPVKQNGAANEVDKLKYSCL